MKTQFIIAGGLVAFLLVFGFLFVGNSAKAQVSAESSLSVSEVIKLLCALGVPTACPVPEVEEISLGSQVGPEYREKQIFYGGAEVGQTLIGERDIVSGPTTNVLASFAVPATSTAAVVCDVTKATTTAFQLTIASSTLANGAAAGYAENGTDYLVNVDVAADVKGSVRWGGELAAASYGIAGLMFDGGMSTATSTIGNVNQALFFPGDYIVVVSTTTNDNVGHDLNFYQGLGGTFGSSCAVEFKTLQ